MTVGNFKAALFNLFLRFDVFEDFEKKMLVL